MPSRSVDIVLNGIGSDLKLFLPIPIVIAQNGSAKLGLKNFNTFNSIPNVHQNVNNTLKIKIPSETNWHVFELPSGSYDLTEINERIWEWLETSRGLVDGRKNFILIGSNATGCCSFIFKQNYSVDFDVKNSIGKLLGFDKSSFEGVGRHEAEKPAKLCAANQLHFNCNVIEGSFFKRKQVPLLYSCNLDVPPGCKITREISQISYKKCNSHQLSYFHVWIEDEQFNLIDLRNDALIVTLSLVIDEED